MLRDCRETFEDASLQDEDGGRGYESRNRSVFQKVKKSKEMDSLSPGASKMNAAC